MSIRTVKLQGCDMLCEKVRKGKCAAKEMNYFMNFFRTCSRNNIFPILKAKTKPKTTKKF